MATDEHIPYNTAPMSMEERNKELEKSGSGTPLSEMKPKKSDKKEKKDKKKGKPDTSATDE